MLVITCINQIPDATQVKTGPDTNTLFRGGIPCIMNSFDTQGPEESLRLRGKNGVRHDAMSMDSPANAEAVLLKACAVNIDGAIHIILVDEGERVAVSVPEMAKMIKGVGKELSAEYLQSLPQAMKPADLAGARRSCAEEYVFVEPLTKTETKVLELVAQGLTNKEIGETLHVSRHTIRSHMRSIHSKLGARHRMEAVSLACRYGFLSHAKMFNSHSIKPEK